MAGIHWVENTEKIIKELEDLGYEVTDTSWKNDTCDSIHIKGMPFDDSCLFLPNSKLHKPEDEAWATFYYKQQYSEDEYHRQFETLEQVINFIKNGYGIK